MKINSHWKTLRLFQSWRLESAKLRFKIEDEKHEYGVQPVQIIIQKFPLPRVGGLEQTLLNLVSLIHDYRHEIG